MIIYLYVKTHNKTGLKYLGKTVQCPYTYLGSGKVWKEHISRFGKDISTEIIKECRDQSELYYWGRYYSNLWNIVEDPSWANCIPETGGGALYGNDNPSKREDVKFKKATKRDQPGYIHPMKKVQNRLKISGKNHQSKKNPEYIKKISGANHYSKKPGYKSKMTGANNPSTRPDVRKKIENTLVERYGVINPMFSEGIRNKVRGKNHYSQKEGFVSPISGENHYSKKSGYKSKISGKNHYTKKDNWKPSPTNKNFDHCVYEWYNTKLKITEKLTRREMIFKYGLNSSCVSELISNKRPHHRHWILVTS